MIRATMVAVSAAGLAACESFGSRDREPGGETQAQAWERREDADNAQQRCHVRAQAERARGIERRRPPECDR